MACRVQWGWNSIGDKAESAAADAAVSDETEASASSFTPNGNKVEDRPDAAVRSALRLKKIRKLKAPALRAACLQTSSGEALEIIHNVTGYALAIGLLCRSSC